MKGLYLIFSKRFEAYQKQVCRIRNLLHSHRKFEMNTNSVFLSFAFLCSGGGGIRFGVTSGGEKLIHKVFSEMQTIR